jgi:hypothetical protein
MSNLNDQSSRHPTGTLAIVISYGAALRGRMDCDVHAGVPRAGTCCAMNIDFYEKDLDVALWFWNR